ncbi:MAG: translation elongation factor 4 [Patescibacteria group bacterium]|jgi:GTP-binding protein LepA|nr:translation elongation factor 4 [Patescibacteria group bacterium]MDD5172991.1 translation elongation factor 4 [Patescibacteria group bacterium]
MLNLNLIRNFCIISHVDHGKSTLADRFLELTGTISKEKMKPQYLDRLPLERERGITIKLQSVTMRYDLEGKEYVLNLIDTPGHVDFSYEVSRSLAAVEGAILLVDAGQGIQAQTLSNLYLAQKQNLQIIPVINKIDLEGIDLENVKKEIINLLKIEEKEIICASAKRGINVEEILLAVINKIPAPKIETDQPLKALIFDSCFDDYRGVIAFVRVFQGSLRAEDKIKFLATNITTSILEVGIFSPDFKKEPELKSGQIGYIVTGLKDIEKCRVGDTISLINGETKPLVGYHEPQSMVFAGLYPKQGDQPEKLRQALTKLKLNDASLIFEPEHSLALGFGFRAGFLGLLHLDVVQERLKREYDLDLVITSPSVAYQIWLKGENNFLVIHSPSEFPDPAKIDKIKEPWMTVDIISPQKYLGVIMDFATTAPQGAKSRTNFLSLEYLSQSENKFEQGRIIIHLEMPLSLLLVDFYDKLKSLTQGYASYSYAFLDYREAEVVKLDILVGGEKVEQLATLVYDDWAYQAGRKIVTALKDILPRQLFEVKVQAAIGGKIIAAERISPLRKDVTAKLYGGDVTRKRKLLEKQKKGKKKMMQLGKVNIPAEAYLAIMKR